MTADSDYRDRFVWFPDGMVVPAPAVLLLLELEARGFRLHADGSTLVVTPADQLTRQDCARLRRWKWHALMLVAHFGALRVDERVFTDGRPVIPEAEQRRLM